MSDTPSHPDLTAAMHASVPFTARLGVVVRSADRDEVVLSLRWDASLTTTGGGLHGGALMSIADAAGAFCAFLNLPDGAAGTTTIESKTNFLGAVVDGDTVTATATPLHVGGTSIVVETRLDTAHRLVGKTLQTQLVLARRS